MSDQLQQFIHQTLQNEEGAESTFRQYVREKARAILFPQSEPVVTQETEQTAVTEGEGEKKIFVKNRKDGKVSGPYASRESARRAMDKKDNAYGAYVHHIIEQ